jgi:hypothetical protein
MLVAADDILQMNVAMSLNGTCAQKARIISGGRGSPDKHGEVRGENGTPDSSG